VFIEARMATSNMRISELDGLRGIAILLVLVWHFTGMLVDPSQGVVQHLAWRYLIFGRSGVDLFFVLSGFLIIGILIDNRDHPNYFTTFYIRRALRILPPYLILVTGLWLCLEVGGGHLHYYFNRQISFFSLFTFTQNWMMASINSYGAMSIAGTWSLAIEEQFYCFAPALIFLLPRRLLPKALFAIAAASIAARSGWYYLYPEYDLAPYVGTVFRLDPLCVGGLIAVACRNSAVWSAIVMRRRVWLFALSLLIAVIPFYSWFLRSDFSNFAEYHLGHTYLAVLYGISLVSILIWSGTPATSWLRSSVLTQAGAISYSLYLFHPSFKALFFAFAHRGEQLTSLFDIVLLTGALISLVAFCALLYRYVELPAQKFGHRFRYETRARASSERPQPQWNPMTK